MNKISLKQLDSEELKQTFAELSKIIDLVNNNIQDNKIISILQELSDEQKLNLQLAGFSFISYESYLKLSDEVKNNNDYIIFDYPEN